MEGRDTGCRGSHGEAGKDLRDMAKKGSMGLDTRKKGEKEFQVIFWAAGWIIGRTVEGEKQKP